MQQLKYKVCLITGASRGIGAAVAKAFAKEGAHVILAARDSKRLEQVDDEIKELGGQATLVPIDLTDFTAIDQMAAAVAQRFKKLDVLVANAGILGELTPLSHVTPDLWNEVINTNLTANWRLIRAFDPLLRAAETGRALFVTDTHAHNPEAYWGPYAVSKAGLEAMATTYGKEVARSGVKVHILNTGDVITDLWSKAFPGKNPKDYPNLSNPEDIAEKFIQFAVK